MGHPLSSEPGKHIKKWVIYHRIHKYTIFALKWNPTQFKLDIHLQMYQETYGSLAYLKSHTVRKLVSLMKYMSLLIRQDRPNAHKHNLFYFISGNQLFKLTAHDMKSALVNEKLENHGSQKYSSKRIKVLNPNPTDTPSKNPTTIQTFVNNPNDTPITVPTIIQTFVIKNGIKPDEPPQNVATSHLKDPISTTTNLDEACSLDTSCDLLHHLDSPSLSSELQDNSSVDSVEIELLPESEEQLDHTKLSPTDVFSEHHDYELFLLQKEFNAPKDNLNHHDIHNCENLDDILIHATNLSKTFALPQFMAQHNCEDHEPTDDPSAVPTASQASCDHTLKPKCAHNPMVILCNQSQYLTLMKKNGVNTPSASQASPTNLSNSLMSQYPPDHGEHYCVPFNLNNTSCRFMLKEVDWGGKHPINFVVDWLRHEPYPTGHNISEVDWRALHDSSFFLFLVNIDYDAKPKDFFTQELWGGLPERTSSTTLRSLNHIEGKLVHDLELQKGPSHLDHSWTNRGTPNPHYVHNMKVVTTYLTNGILGRNLCSLNSSGQLYQLRSFTSYGFNLNTISVAY